MNMTERTTRMFALGMLADMIHDAIADGQITSLSATVVSADGTITQYLAAVGQDHVVRLIIPRDRLPELEALRESMIDATPPEAGP